MTTTFLSAFRQHREPFIAGAAGFTATAIAMLAFSGLFS